MPQKINLLGKKFGDLTVVESAPNINKKTAWKCRCPKGHITIVATNHLRNGSISKCSICSKEEQKQTNFNYSNDILKKHCPICEEDFYTHARNRIYCYECSPRQFEFGSKEYVLAKQRAIKKALVKYKGGKCEICGYNKYIGALQFHHRDPSQKDFELSKHKFNKQHNMNVLKKEADKCMLVCANCHFELHRGE